MKRRTFLEVTAATAAGGALFPRQLWAAPFGEFPANALDAQLPAQRRAKNVLEVFLYGGLSAWETLYLVEEYGAGNGTQYYTFPAGVSAAVTACGGTSPTVEFFAQDANQADVKLGPFAMPLRARTDVTARMRLLVHRHTLEPHEAAIPLALTGKPVGSPSLAGIGAHVQRFWLDRPEPGRRAPYSYLFSTGGLPGDNVSAAAATGLHPGLARPLTIKVDNSQRLYDLLSRPGVGTTADRALYDAAMQVYVDRYRNRLRFEGAGNPLRSARLANLAQAVASVNGSDAIAAVLDPTLFTPQAATVCGDGVSINVPAMSLKTAVHLLTHATEPARYVCVSDTGLIEASGGGGYDTHTDNSHDTARNFTNVLTELMSLINAPAENDPAKLSLDDTLIILNTEFGRTPDAQGTTGRNHWPYGYVTAFLGGPITAAEKGIVGAIGADGRATSFVTAAESRMAALLALGIWPFSQEAFFVSDVQGASTERDAARDVTARLLGVQL